MLPAGRINPASVALLNYYPNQLYPGIVQNYSVAVASPSQSHSIGLRLNGPVTTKDTLTFNQQYSGNDSTSKSNIFGFTDTGSGYGLSSSVGWRHVFKPRFNNSANLTFSRNISKTTPYFAYGANIAAQLGITGTDQSPIDYGPPSLSFTNFNGMSDASRLAGPQPDHQLHRHGHLRGAAQAQSEFRIRVPADAKQPASPIRMRGDRTVSAGW